MGFGERIKLLRETNGLERSEFADKVGITYHALSKYETNERQPDFDTLQKLADYFSVTTDYLLGRHVSDTFRVRIDEPAKVGVKIPVLGAIPAGIPIEAIEDILDWEEIPPDWLSGGRQV